MVEIADVHELLGLSIPRFVLGCEVVGVHEDGNADHSRPSRLDLLEVSFQHRRDDDKAVEEGVDHLCVQVSVCPIQGRVALIDEGELALLEDTTDPQPTAEGDCEEAPRWRVGEQD